MIRIRLRLWGRPFATFFSNGFDENVVWLNERKNEIILALSLTLCMLLIYVRVWVYLCDTYVHMLSSRCSSDSYNNTFLFFFCRFFLFHRTSMWHTQLAHFSGRFLCTVSLILSLLLACFLHHLLLLQSCKNRAYYSRWVVKCTTTLISSCYRFYHIIERTKQESF